MIGKKEIDEYDREIERFKELVGFASRRADAADERVVELEEDLKAVLDDLQRITLGQYEEIKELEKDNAYLITAITALLDAVETASPSLTTKERGHIKELRAAIDKAKDSA